MQKAQGQNLKIIGVQLLCFVFWSQTIDVENYGQSKLIFLHTNDGTHMINPSENKKKSKRILNIKS